MWVSRPLFIWAKDDAMKNSVSEQIREIAARVAEENSLEFVHTEVIGANENLTIRVFIDKKGGVTHEDCALVSRNIETILDAGDFVPSAYLLEVSSPGLERVLYSLKDFEKFVGHLAKVKTETPIDEQKNCRGRIIGIKDKAITISGSVKARNQLR